MPQPSDPGVGSGSLRDKIIGLGERSIQKSYYPELQRRLSELERFRALLDQSLDMLFLLDYPSGRIEDVTTSTCALLGCSRQELINLPFETITSSPDKVVPYLRQSCDAATGKFSLDTDLLRKSGSPIPVELVFSPVVFEAGACFIVIARDISERKHNEEAIRQLNASLETRIAERTEELKQANQELESFAYSVSHDLRAPLRLINGYASILSEDYSSSLDGQGKEYLSRIREASLHMSNIISGLLEISRANRSALNPTPINLSEMARSIQSDLQTGQPNRQVEWIIPEDVCAIGDGVLVRVVLENLLQNAWKFTSHHASARIELGQYIDDELPVFFVRDDGAGFDMADAKKLFTPFERLHSASEFEGTGIGLSIVARIIHRHGGKIWAESQPENGTTIYFTLAPDK